MLASTWAGIKNEIIWHEKSILYRNIIVFLTLARSWFWPTTKSGVRESKICKCVISCRVGMSCSPNSTFVDWLSRNHLTCQGGSIPVWPCKANIESWREFPQFCEWGKEYYETERHPEPRQWKRKANFMQKWYNFSVSGFRVVCSSGSIKHFSFPLFPYPASSWA